MIVSISASRRSPLRLNSQSVRCAGASDRSSSECNCITFWVIFAVEQSRFHSTLRSLGQNVSGYVNCGCKLSKLC